MLGFAVGHLYYFLTVLYPLAGGRFNFGTPLWVHKLVAFWGVGYQQNAPIPRKDTAVPDVFQGRGRGLGGARTSASTQAQPSSSEQAQPNQGNDGVAFRGRSYRLDGGRQQVFFSLIN
ncbi:hypothetical protein Vadar_020962 [Vaccinium darrowii]|uniref:Uncharacterized protein n=1 Tax=Vaccinium darrowii TaxID=229202 RepID=A0ACB7YQE5_9ERIC|nr:hypothetical protein Vadar_020962 [Vaccinium darrowii]